MAKLTPQDYIDAGVSLERTGFIAIRSTLDDSANSKTIPEVAATYGIPERVVELVKTTSSYSEYQTIVRLETERASLSVELDEVKEQEARIKPKRWHYAIATVILIAIAALIVWGIAALLHALVVR